MTTITFDTMKANHKLQDAGFDAVQAAAMVDTVAEAFTDTVATKADVTEVKAELKADIARLESRMDSGLANLKAAVASSRAVNTRRAYRQQWARFTDWMQAR